MEFTKDDYVIEGNLEVTTVFDNERGGKFSEKVNKVTFRNSWVMVEVNDGYLCMINKDKLRSISIREV